MENALVSLPAVLAAVTVKFDLLIVVGVPEITPAAERVNPSGNAPLARLQVMGASPAAASVWLYVNSMVPTGNEAVVMVTCAIVIESGLASFPMTLVTPTVKSNVPASAGVPEITPVASARVNPSGSAPLARLQVMGASPVAASVWLYTVPTVPFANESVVIAGGIMGATVRESSMASFPVALAALTVKSNVPASVGVPEITPVASPRVNPSGNAPLARLQVMGASPAAASVWLYAVPTVPFGNVVVVMVGAIPVPPSSSSQAKNVRASITAKTPNTMVCFVFMLLSFLTNAHA